MSIQGEKKRLKDKACQLLQEQIESYKDVKSKEDWNSWLNITTNYVERIFGQNSREMFTITSFTKQEEAIGLVESFIKSIKLLGLPNDFFPSAGKSEINFHNNNNLSQTQNIELKITFEAIRDELPPARLREIQEIADSEEPKENKLFKITEKLKDTGIEVVSLTLAKIIGQAMGVQ